ncbi:MAG: AAA family ATPase [Alphaproteobacteria bacterium]|nr:AAA family ATPase [Alphaproteobacteria bacterium]
MNRRLTTHYGLKWNPFGSDVPEESLRISGPVHSFCWRVENHLVRQGGFALVTGEPGTGKSATMRMLAHGLQRIDGLSVAALTHPSSSLVDFYREMGEAFGISLAPHNRWGGFKELRRRWLEHLDEVGIRAVLLVDEAQELLTPVIAEMRLLASTDFDSRSILSVVLAGDNRLVDRLRSPELRPLASRIRHRLVMKPVDAEELAHLLDHLLKKAGNPGLMTPGLKSTLCAHAGGNLRALTVMGDTLLAAAAEQDREVLDEQLFIDTWGEPAKPRGARR